MWAPVFLGTEAPYKFLISTSSNTVNSRIRFRNRG